MEPDTVDSNKDGAETGAEPRGDTDYELETGMEYRDKVYGWSG